MKIAYSIIVVIIAIAVLYLIYKYLFAAKKVEDIKVIDTPTVVIKKSPCDDLPSMKEMVDKYYYNAIKARDNYNQGFSIIFGSWGVPIGQTVTNKEELKNIFGSANYYYKNEIIKYNGIIQANDCGSTPLLETEEIKINQ